MKILFIHPDKDSFTMNDLQILSEAHTVSPFYFRTLKCGFKQTIKSLPTLWRYVQWADLTFSWFGKLHAFFVVLFSKMLGKKAVVIAGGDDVAYEPDIKYGMFSFWWKKWCPLFVFRYADLILSVSEYTHRGTIENAKANPDKIKLLYHGFDDQKWQCFDGIAKENIVLTVANITNETFKKKGLDIFVQSASYLPKIPFIIVGPWHDNAINLLRDIASPNVVFTGGLYNEKLMQMYSRAKVYVQASVHESFGCSVAEAMLCECIPVVSKKAALPEVVGNCGFYIDELTPEAVALQIEKAMTSDLDKRAREQIIRKFPLERRRKELIIAIKELSNQ